MKKSLQTLINEKDYNAIFSQFVTSEDINALYKAFSEDAVHNAIVRILRSIHEVVDMQMNSRKAKRIIIEYIQETLEELDDYEMKSIPKLTDMESLSHISDNEFAYDDSEIFGDFMDNLYANQLYTAIHNTYLMKCKNSEELYIAERNVDIFDKYLKDGYTFNEIAKIHNISTTRVGQLMRRMLRVAKYLAEYDGQHTIKFFVGRDILIL